MILDIFALCSILFMSQPPVVAALDGWLGTPHAVGTSLSPAGC